jgi:hypothetical protein
MRISFLWIVFLSFPLLESMKPPPALRKPIPSDEELLAQAAFKKSHCINLCPFEGHSIPPYSVFIYDSIGNTFSYKGDVFEKEQLTNIISAAEKQQPSCFINHLEVKKCPILGHKHTIQLGALIFGSDTKAVIRKLKLYKLLAPSRQN